MIISTKCISGHKFKVPKEKIQTSSSGKSFVTLCPKCNKVARLRKEDVYSIFGVNPRDHVAVGNLFASMSGQTQTTVVPQNGATFPGATQVRATVTEDPDDDDDESDEMEEDNLDDENDSDDKEYTAQVEMTADVTGAKKKVKRFRVVSDEDEDDSDDSDDEVEQTPVKSSRQVKKPMKRVKAKPRAVRDEEEEEEEDEEDDRDDRRSGRRGSMMDDFADPADPNDILKDIITDSGMDERDIDRVFEYIDIQPDGWQPSAIKGVLEMFISPAAANRLSQKYQGALYIEQKKREKEQYLMQMMGSPAGNMRLNNTMGGMNTPPFNSPVNRGMPQTGTPFGGQGLPQYTADPRGYPQGFAQPPQNSGYPPYETPQTPARRSMSPFEIKQMISDELESKFEKLQNTISQTKREDSLQNELAQMRTLVFDVLREKGKDNSGGAAHQPDPLLVSLLTNQSDLNKTLMTHTLTKTEDPMQRILMQELAELKKVKSATPSLSHTTEELTQRIQLQKLANELELAQAEFRDKSESRAFTRDLAGQALTKIGESFATAYIESSRISAAQPVSVQTPPPVEQVAVSVTTDTKNAQESTKGRESSAQTRAPDSKPTDEIDPSRFVVRGTSKDDGTLEIPCPTCGSPIDARMGDTQVTCGICGSVFNATNTTQTHKYADSEPINENEPQQEQEQEREREPVVEEEPKKLKPAKIL